MNYIKTSEVRAVEALIKDHTLKDISRLTGIPQNRVTSINRRHIKHKKRDKSDVIDLLSNGNTAESVSLLTGVNLHTVRSISYKNKTRQKEMEAFKTKVNEALSQGLKAVEVYTELGLKWDTFAHRIKTLYGCTYRQLLERKS